jgi:hypothetical protein
MLPIGINRDLPVPICPIDGRACGFEPCDNLRRGVPEWIPSPAADERNLRLPGFE